ncbi:hypothetical protein P12x_005315 [Tundrisphaera lichenicola]|uniref:hypothetical protein n=1 Tax=Tundrisphaera lichenicola TaxID=2029860 RepID=UPI003EC12A1D
MADGFETLAQITAYFPTEDNYVLSRDAAQAGLAYLNEARATADAMDAFLKRRLGGRKSGEVHISPSLIRRLIEIPPPPEDRLPPGATLAFHSFDLPHDGPFATVVYRGQLPVTGSTPLSIELSVQIGANRVPRGSTVDYSVRAITATITVDPAFENPQSSRPTDPFYYTKIQPFLNAYLDVLASVFRQSLYTFSIDSPEKMPPPDLFAFIDGVSIFLWDSRLPTLTVTPRDNTHELAIVAGLKEVEDEIVTRVTQGEERDDEDDYTFVTARDFQVLASPQRLHFNVFYHWHEFIAGDKGCNWLYCWDTRMWVGARDNVPIDLRFAMEWLADGTSLKLVIHPQYPNYDVPGGAIYKKNLRLVPDWVFAPINAIINNTVNGQLHQLEDEKIDFPLFDDDLRVQFAEATVFDGGPGHFLRVNIDFRP